MIFEILSIPGAVLGLSFRMYRRISGGGSGVVEGGLWVWGG